MWLEAILRLLTSCAFFFIKAIAYLPKVVKLLTAEGIAPSFGLKTDVQFLLKLSGEKNFQKVERKKSRYNQCPIDFILKMTTNNKQRIKKKSWSKHLGVFLQTALGFPRYVKSNGGKKPLSEHKLDLKWLSHFL